MEEFKKEKIEELKKKLRKNISFFCTNKKEKWKDPVLQMLLQIKSNNWRAVIFGGTIRSLMVGQGSSRRPRDIDIVLNSVNVEQIKNEFSELVVRQTRFGGVKLQDRGIEFDIWPLDKTWAYVSDNFKYRTYVNLPKTTFLNIEAVAVDLWPNKKGEKRNIYTDNDSFFKSILTKTLEINRHENPFPSLCIVRSLLMAASLKFKIGHKLAEYIDTNGAKLSSLELENIQIKHYGRVKIQGKILLEWIDYIHGQRTKNADNIYLPMPREQLYLWGDNNKILHPTVNIFCE